MSIFKKQPFWIGVTVAGLYATYGPLIVTLFVILDPGITSITSLLVGFPTIFLGLLGMVVTD